MFITCTTAFNKLNCQFTRGIVSLRLCFWACALNRSILFLDMENLSDFSILVFLILCIKL